MLASVDIQRRYLFVACGLYMNGCITIKTVKAMIGSGNIEFTIAVFTDVGNSVLVLAVLKITLDMVAVPTPQSLVVGDDPQIAVAVFHQTMDGLGLAQALVHLASFLLTVHLQNAMA